MKVTSIAFSAFLLVLTGCIDSDPFGMSKKKILDGYSLHQFESDDYYLEKKGRTDSGGGVIDGVVLEVGWNQQTIAAKRKANYRGDGDGWMIVHLESDQIEGPLTEKEFRTKFPDMQTYSAMEAWNQL